jgi:hypothetical protein
MKKMTDKVTEVINDVLREVYSEAEPGLDWDHLLENAGKYADDWYDQHELDAEKEREILHRHLEKHDLTDHEESKVRMTAILHYGPANPE